jgi:hypothetical protein
VESRPEKQCLECSAPTQAGHPFCLQCGKVAPFAFSSGDFAVEIQEVPSESLRTQALALLKRWFPGIDVIRADKMLRSGRAILLTGVDETSAENLLRTLKPLKINGRIVEYRSTDWWRFLWNPGLILSVPAVVAAWGLDGFAAALSTSVAVAAPVIGAFLERSGSQPVIKQEKLHYVSDEWLRSAKEYSDTIKELSEEDADALKSIVGKIFELQKRLSSRSLVAAAAGSEKGELYGKLMDAMATAIQICQRIRAQKEDDKSLREDMASLESLVTEIGIWYASVDTSDHKPIPQLKEEVEQITDGIDRIVKEVRHASDRQSIIVERSRIME